MPCFAGLTPTAHIAHRGGAALYPENTLHAFERAVRDHRTDAIETDLHRTADGVLVLSHDPTVDRCTDGTGAIAELTWDAIRRLDATATHPELAGHGIGIPRLEDLLTAFPRLRLNIDLKPDDPTLIPDFVTVIRAFDAAPRLCCGSTDDAVGMALCEALPEATHFMPRGSLTTWVMAALAGHDVAHDRRFTVADMPAEWEGVHLVTPALMARAAQHAVWVNVWTIDDEDEMRRLVGLGVHGIMTDRPDLLRAVLDAA